MFKAVVTGNPKPTVTWNRANGEITDDDKFKSKYDDTSGENTLEVSGIFQPHGKMHVSHNERADDMSFVLTGVICNQIKKVSPAEADTYKCFAVNEYGKAICTATLNVIAGKGYIMCSLDWE